MFYVLGGTLTILLNLSIAFSDLRFNKIRHIPPGSLRNLSSLHTLYLNNNQMKKLRKNSFGGLDRLKYL
jgi:Leucine-rich repeat (LRR) protein